MAKGAEDTCGLARPSLSFLILSELLLRLPTHYAKRQAVSDELVGTEERQQLTKGENVQRRDVAILKGHAGRRVQDNTRLASAWPQGPSLL